VFHRLLGRLHAAVLRPADAVLVRPAGGQGTVEYVALILLVAVVLAGVVAASRKVGGPDIAQTLVKKLKEAMGSVKP
jgi:hypothetical protein